MERTKRKGPRSSCDGLFFISKLCTAALYSWLMYYSKYYDNYALLSCLRLGGVSLFFMALVTASSSRLRAFSSISEVYYVGIEGSTQKSAKKHENSKKKRVWFFCLNFRAGIQQYHLWRYDTSTLRTHVLIWQALVGYEKF